ncbi:MAG TPA: TetR/AcrR family transcriptional regulator, partial [Mycobacterium sp.]|nr:TetR/AcrR family transcriptional regulator [Mycobacterium sp.]
MTLRFTDSEIRTNGPSSLGGHALERVRANAIGAQHRLHLEPLEPDRLLLIATSGLANTKIEDIAAASGVPKATLYYYFAGKDEILSFLLRDSLSLLAREVADAADAPGLGRERLIEVIAVQIEHTMNRPGSSRALVGDLGR